MVAVENMQVGLTFNLVVFKVIWSHLVNFSQKAL